MTRPPVDVVGPQDFRATRTLRPLPHAGKRHSGRWQDDGGPQFVAAVCQRRLVVEPVAAVAQGNDVEIANAGHRGVALWHQETGTAGGDGEAGPFGEVLLRRGPPVVGSAAVRQYGRDPGASRVPCTGPSGQRDATLPPPRQAVPAGGEP